MCCMGVAMICVGATYEDDVSTYLNVGGIFVLILYLLPLLLEQKFLPSIMIPLLFPLPLVCLGILIWGTIMVIIASGNIITNKLKS